MFRKILFAISALFFIHAAGQTSDCIPPKPLVETSVYDYANLLSEGQKKALERKLIGYSDSTSTQIVVAVTADLCGGDIAMTATEWAHKWGIGQKGKDNGVFILLSPSDRKIFIATGYGVEGSLTDAMTRRIIEQNILPEFRKGDYYAGLDAGTDAIFKVLTGEFKADARKAESGGGGTWALIPVIIFAVVMIAAFSSKGGKEGAEAATAVVAVPAGALLPPMRCSPVYCWVVWADVLQAVSAAAVSVLPEDSEGALAAAVSAAAGPEEAGSGGISHRRNTLLGVTCRSRGIAVRKAMCFKLSGHRQQA